MARVKILILILRVSNGFKPWSKQFYIQSKMLLTPAVITEAILIFFLFIPGFECILSFAFHNLLWKRVPRFNTPRKLLT